MKESEIIPGCWIQRSRSSRVIRAETSLWVIVRPYPTLRDTGGVFALICHLYRSRFLFGDAVHELSSSVINDCSKVADEWASVEKGGDAEKGSPRKREKDGKEKAIAAEVAVTLRLVFLITRDPGRAEEELLSDVSIMTRLYTVVYTPDRRFRARGEVARLGVSPGALPAQGAR